VQAVEMKVKVGFFAEIQKEFLMCGMSKVTVNFEEIWQDGTKLSHPLLAEI